jgi:hypothetical protein
MDILRRNKMNRLNMPRFVEHPYRMPLFVIFIGVIFIFTVSLACNAPSPNGSTNETQTVLNIQATQLALQEDAQGESQAEAQIAQDNTFDELQATQTAQAATQIAIDVQSTTIAQEATIAASTVSAQIPTVTSQPPPDPTPTDLAPTDPIPTEAPINKDEIINEMMQDADILLFENVTKIPLPRYIKQALDNLGLSRNYVDTKDATGNFKSQLLSGIDWDLIVVGVEARSAIQGEFFDYFNEQINDGTSVVLEIWNLDEIAGAKATSFLTNCGIKVQGDWYDPPMTSRSIWWLYGEHPVFHEPNEGMSLVNYSPYWSGDAGDLLKTIPGSDAILLAGTYAQEKNSHGLLAVCHDDRVIIQTYSSHDYRQDDVVRLWENYIYNALRAHFELVIGQ